MHDRLRGEAVAARDSATQTISHSSVLAPDKRNPEDAFAILDRLVQKAAVRLRKSGHYASRLSVGIKYLDGSRWDADMRLVDTQDTMTFLHALAKLWTGRPRDRRTILQVGMAFSDLVSEAGHTGSLFAAESKSKSLYATLDKLNARFGKQAVYFASAHKARDRGGMHIAFNHIPDPETER
jgi:DNA polymerase-4